jgi:hypothetical protein
MNNTQSCTGSLHYCASLAGQLPDTIMTSDPWTGDRATWQIVNLERNRRGTFIVFARRGVLVVPAESGWIVQGWAADLTSRSLQNADPTSGSLQSAYATSSSLQNADPTSGSLQKLLSENDLRLDDGHKGFDSPRNKMLSCKKRFRVGHGLSRVPCILNSGRGKAGQRFQRDARTGLAGTREVGKSQGAGRFGAKGRKGQVLSTGRARRAAWLCGGQSMGRSGQVVFT